MTDTVGALLIKDDLVLLGLRAAHKSYSGCWDVIGGHVEHGETAWTALCREVTEELGVEIDRAEYMMTMTLLDPSGPSNLDIYRVSAWNGDPSVQNDEHVQIRWFALEEAERLSNLATSQYRGVFRSIRGNPLQLNGE